MTDWVKVIKAISPNADKRIVKMIADHADEVFAKWKLNTPLRQATLLGHMYVETGFYKTLEENLNYSAKRMTQVWPKRFPTIASATPYAHNPKALAIKTYGSRMGNRPGTDDGWTFRGKGGLQTTGRDNHEKLARFMGVDVNTVVSWLTHPDHMFDCAAATFVMLGAVGPADRDDMIASTKHIQGGSLHLAERTSAKNRALNAIKKFSSGKTEVSSAPVPAPTGPRVEELDVEKMQRRLNDLGYRTGGIDGDFGRLTRSALRDFQDANHLPTDGIASPEVLKTLYSEDAVPYLIPSVRANATVETLREEGSKTISAADTVQRAITGALGSGGSAIAVVAEMNNQKNTVKQVVSDNADTFTWATTHWQYFAAAILALVAAFFIYRVYAAAQEVKKQRVHDHQTGANLAR